MGRKTISLDELDQLEIDEVTSDLYWKGKRVMTEVRLPWALNFWIGAGAIATVASVVLTALGMFGVIPPPPQAPIKVEVTVVLDGKVVGTGQSP